MEKDEVKVAGPEDGNGVAAQLSRALFSRGKYDNPWSTWQARTPYEALKWTLSRKTPPLPSKEELDRELPVEKPDWEAINNPQTSCPLRGSDQADGSDCDEAEAEDATSSASGRSASCIQTTWVGHSTFLVQMEGVNFLTDPVWADRCSPLNSVHLGPKRFRPVPFGLDELPQIDFVIVSHNHYDHLDIGVVEHLGNKAKWYVPIGLRKWFQSCGVENVEELNWWESAEFVKTVPSDDGGEREVRIQVVATPCQHWSIRSGFDRCKSLWTSWAVAGASNRVWFAGDTGYCPAFKEIGDTLGPFNLGLIPIGAYCPRDFMQPQHIDPAEAVQIHEDIRAHTSIGMHWGTFVLTDEHVFEPRSRIAELVNAKNMRGDEFITVRHGETKVLPTSPFAEWKAITPELLQDERDNKEEETK